MKMFKYLKLKENLQMNPEDLKPGKVYAVFLQSRGDVIALSELKRIKIEEGKITQLVFSDMASFDETFDNEWSISVNNLYNKYYYVCDSKLIRMKYPELFLSKPYMD